VAVAVLAAFGATAWIQVGTWRSTEVLYRHALSVTDGNYVAHQALGSELLRQQRVVEAERSFKEASRLAPGYPPPRLGLADVALARGRVAEALRAYHEELKRDPGNVGAAGRYGLALGLMGRYAEARVHLERALAVHTGTAELHRAMAEVEAALGHPRASVRHGREALRLSPEYIEAANNLAWTLATCHDPTVRDPAEAIRLIEAVASQSDDPWLLDTLAAAYAAAGDFDLAVSTASRAVSMADERDHAADAREIRARLSLYRLGRPFVDPGPPGGPGSEPSLRAEPGDDK
jgi:spermidine synthase